MDEGFYYVYFKKRNVRPAGRMCDMKNPPGVECKQDGRELDEVNYRISAPGADFLYTDGHMSDV